MTGNTNVSDTHEDEVDGCMEGLDVVAEDADVTLDEDLPAAEGGVA